MPKEQQRIKTGTNHFINTDLLGKEKETRDYKKTFLKPKLFRDMQLSSQVGQFKCKLKAVNT
jgi:hypothetical protein